MSRSELSRRSQTALFSLFLVSGLSSLVYQILWVRLLSLTLGSTVFAISVVVSSFMGGLALGSALFGRKADQARSPLRLYGLLEAGIALCALAIPFAFDAITRMVSDSATRGGLGAESWFPYTASFLTLLVPTTLMGGTLPVLARFVVGLRGSRGGLIGALYAVNTIGAIAGTALAGFVLIRAQGILATTHLAAGINLLVCAASFVLASRWRMAAALAPVEQPAPAAPEVVSSAPEGHLLKTVTFVYFVNGLVGLGLEILWTRAIVLFTVSTVYAFTVILTTFLVGLALGSAIMARLMRRIERAAPLLGALQCVIGLIAGLTPIGLSLFGVDIFRALTQGTADLGRGGEILSAYVVASIFMLPATLLMGASFPLVAHLVTQAKAQVGAAVGRVYAWNTLGAVLGSLLAGFLLLPRLGIQHSIMALALLSTIAGSALILRAGSRAWRALALASGLSVAAGLVFSENHFRTMLERWLEARFTFYEEGIETTVAVFDSERAQRPVLVINNSVLDDRGVVHKMLAHIPALLHKDPKSALVLGFGVGLSSASLASHDLERNHCVEISEAVMNAAPFFAELNGNIAARTDANFQVFVTDGRKLLMGASQPYDIIALDANWGNLRKAGVGKLYTREFFELCKKRLAKDGMVTLYASPNGWMREFKMMARSFTDVFPHTSLWMDRAYAETSVMVASLEPLEIDLGRYLERVQRPKVQRDLEALDLDGPGTLLSFYCMGPEMLRHFCSDGEINTDDHPVMEYHPLRLNAFEVDDNPFGDMGLQLHRESILTRLRFPEGLPGGQELKAYLENAERSFYLQCDAWFHRTNPDRRYAQASLLMAAELHPEAEHLRSLLGYGRKQRQEARQSAERAATPTNLERVAGIAVQRGEFPEAAEAFERAIASGLNQLPREHLADLHLGAARARRSLGEIARAREHLAAAQKLGHEGPIEGLEIELADQRSRGQIDPRGLRELIERNVQQQSLVRAFTLLRLLEDIGGMDSRMHTYAALCLEVFGDMVGAFSHLERAQSLDPNAKRLEERLQVLVRELSLRAHLHRTAYAGDPRWRDVLESPFVKAAFQEPQLLPSDHEQASPWLDLAGIYGKTNRPLMAYRKARVARYYEPRNVPAYLAVGRWSATMGSHALARLSYERALELEPSNVEAQNGLANLPASSP